MSIRTFVLAAVSLGFPLIALSQPLNQASGLSRLTDREDLLGWEAVGRIDAEGVGFCTGTLITTTMVLTAAHCVYHPRTQEEYDPGLLTFRAGLSDGHAIAERKVARIAAHSGYSPNDGISAENLSYDVALLELARPIYSNEVNPFAVHAGPIGGSKVSVVSYGKGRSEALSRQKECQIIGHGKQLIAFNCDVTFGSSGAPVFVKTGNRARILSVISSISFGRDEKTAYGMELPKVVADLKSQLRGTPPSPSEGARRITVGAGKANSGAKFVRP